MLLLLCWLCTLLLLRWGVGIAVVVGGASAVAAVATAYVNMLYLLIYQLKKSSACVFDTFIINKYVLNRFWNFQQQTKLPAQLPYMFLNTASNQKWEYLSRPDFQTPRFYGTPTLPMSGSTTCILFFFW